MFHYLWLERSFLYTLRIVGMLYFRSIRPQNRECVFDASPHKKKCFALKEIESSYQIHVTGDSFVLLTTFKSDGFHFYSIYKLYWLLSDESMDESYN